MWPRGWQIDTYAPKPTPISLPNNILSHYDRHLCGFSPDPIKLSKRSEWCIEVGVESQKSAVRSGQRQDGKWLVWFWIGPRDPPNQHQIVSGRVDTLLFSNRSFFMLHQFGVSNVVSVCVRVKKRRMAWLHKWPDDVGESLTRWWRCDSNLISGTWCSRRGSTSSCRLDQKKKQIAFGFSFSCYWSCEQIYWETGKPRYTKWTNSNKREIRKRLFQCSELCK